VVSDADVIAASFSGGAVDEDHDGSRV